ncbi:hypothetical protein FXN61_07905 [Lentzea sp. PSKA42]|uniref:DUF7617 domain-containing protein n=1 Tax=Lentzea indica TaxID=2604800 RepID=A0ABX1FCX3_9PSEU|nr:hypothetical protein [Lentzea indica]NKE56760.1 hypothetical protein [Lentzea indica]
MTRLLIVLVLGAGSATAAAGSAAADVITPFTQVYNKVVYGDFNIIGNTVTRCPAAPSPFTPAVCADGASRTDPNAVNDEYQMAWADVDTSAATFNSSSASLTIPPGATIDYARLYWAGNTGLYTDWDGLVISPLCSGNALVAGQLAITPPGAPQTQPVSIRVGSGAAVSVAAQTFVNEPPAEPTEAQYYSASANITSLFSAAATGSPLTMTVGNVWTPQGYNCFGGWSLTLVYKYPQPEPTYAPVPREVFVYDGHVRQDSLQPPTTVPITGFRYPGGPLRAGVTAYEGDWGISGDQFLVNGIAVAEPSGTGTGNFFVDSADGQVNPNTPNNFSVDAKDFTLPPGTLPVGATDLNLEFNTTGDSYLAQQVAFSVPLPTLNVVKEVCASSAPVDCGPGGAGPWAENTLMSAASTAYWRIRVTNPTTVDIPGATLNDPATPACATAAGTFAVLAGQTATFHCNSPNLTAALVNSVTARFVPPGSPAGTTPIDTAPDTARADVHALTIAKQVCSSLVAADCGAGGAGPWAELATIPADTTARWKITVTNTGSVELTGVTINDAAQPGCATAAGTFSLAAGTSASFYCSTTNVAAGSTNTVTAQYVPPGSPAGTPAVVTPPDDARVRVSGLTVAKDVCGSAQPADCGTGGIGPWQENRTLPTGSTAYWRITVTNTGEADLTAITLNDSGEASCVTAAGSFDLAVDATLAFYCSTANVAANKTNTVTAQYVPPAAAPGTLPVVTAPDGATVNVYGLALTKEVCASLNAADCASGGPWVETANLPSGATARWRITATNTGDVDLTGIALNDPTEASCVAAPFNLAAGASASFYCSTANVTAGRTNTATATFTPPGGAETTTAPSSASVRVTNLAVAKEICTGTDCGPGGAGPWADTSTMPTGSTAYWRITVTNTGEADLTAITLNDPAEASCVAAPFNLAASASTSFYCSTADLTTNKTNTATAQYVPPGAPAGTTPIVSAPDDATATVFGLVLAKEVCSSRTAEDCASGGPWVETANIPSGFTARWRITVTNTGDVDLTGIVLNDAAEPGCAAAAGSFDVSAGESKSFYCSTTNVTESVTNTVTATFKPPGGSLLTTSPDSAVVNVTNLAVAKEVCTSLTTVDCSGTIGPWAETANLPSGSTAHWRITVTNSGEVDLTDITVTDEDEPTCEQAAFNLAVGATKTLYCSTANVTAGLTNTVAAQYAPPGSGASTTTEPDSAAVIVTNLAVAKEICTETDCDDGPWSDTASLLTGSTAQWRITVTNTGDVDLTGIVLNDPSEASCATEPFDLAANASKTIHCSTTNLTKNTTNTVTAQYTPPGAPPGTEPVVTPPDGATANVYGLTLVKEVCAASSETHCGPGGPGPWGVVANIPSGSSVYWRITATNTGDVDLSGITLTDKTEPGCDAEFDLAAGASASFYCSTANVTESVQNEATASFGMMGWPEEVTTEAVAEVSIADLHVEKEICAALTAAECDTGPWVYSATVPRGATARWRITVTNTGDVDLTGIVLNDPSEASCATEPFDLAANASKTIHCSTTNLTKNTTNAVTAQYVPPGSPPDTAPTITAPADATAMVSDLLVRKDICQSAVPEECAETGKGPWADDHVVERGGTARWRITVTNAGEVDLTGIALHDGVEPSCSIDGIDLAAGVSASFTCSTTNVTSGMTNTVTGRYVPPGAPAATPPLATPPDDASVRVADLNVRKEVCLTGDAAACDSWGETVTIHSGGTAHWRVTVVNTGEVDLGEVTVQDSVEPGCAANAFALPSGAEKTVHCATAGLTQAVVNTATATYTLPGGGPPVVTRPDSAGTEMSSASAPPTSPPLVVTGSDVWLLVAIGLLLAGSGMLLRLYARRRA